MHAGFQAVALIVRGKGAGSTGGEKRSGGETAKGTPKNWLTTAVAVGKRVVVPTTHPASTWTVGL